MSTTSVFPFYHLRGSSQLKQELLAAGGSKGFLSLWHFPLHLNFHIAIIQLFYFTNSKPYRISQENIHCTVVCFQVANCIYAKWKWKFSKKVRKT